MRSERQRAPVSLNLSVYAIPGSPQAEASKGLQLPLHFSWRGALKGCHPLNPPAGRSQYLRWNQQASFEVTFCEERMQPNARKTILLADDGPLREALKKLLHRGGYNVIVATDGLQALNEARAYDGRIDLLLSDIRMPKHDRHRTCEATTPRTARNGNPADDSIPEPSYR